MTREKVLEVKNFKGIDRRRKIYSSPADVLWDAKNCDLTTGGGITIRDKLVKIATLNANSIGLYAAGGKLRTAVPAGNSIESTAPVNVAYDAISNLTAGATSTSLYTDLASWTTWDADGAGLPLPYLVLKTSSGQYEHHYVDGDYKTKVTLPFTPGKNLVKLASKLFADSPSDGTVHCNSTVNGARDWTTSGDAGFIDVVNHATGDTRLQGLTFYNSQLAIFFPDSIQFWQVDANPSNFMIVRTLKGPGTVFAGSVAPVISDLYYFSFGGFRSLQAQNILGELRQDPFGDKIAALTAPFADVDTYEVKGFWSQARSQYLCFFSDGSTTTVFAYKNSPLGGVDGWTYWELGIPADYIVELDETLYIRSGNDVYKFVAVEEDEEVDYEWSWETPMYDGEAPRRLKQWTFIDMDFEGRIDSLKYRSDDASPDTTWQGGYNIVGPTASGGSIPVCALSHKLGMLATGNYHFLIDSAVLQYAELSGAG